MGSTRLPGKALRALGGKPLIWHIVDRVRRADCCDTIILATTTDPRNEPMVDFAEDLGLAVVLEEVEDDLAARIAKAVSASGADFVLKTSGDCPLLDPKVMAGQGTLALEFLEQVVASSGRPLDAIIVPVGGGGPTAAGRAGTPPAEPGVPAGVPAEPAGPGGGVRGAAGGSGGGGVQHVGGAGALMNS